jgi:hypothetical protein
MDQPADAETSRLKAFSSHSRSAVRPVPFLRPGYVTRIDSLHRLPLSAAWTGSTVIRYVTLAEPKHGDRQSLERSGLHQRLQRPYANSRLNQRDKTELKFQTRVSQSR